MSYEIKRRTNGILYVEFEDLEGKRKRISLKTRDPGEAKTLARNVYAEHFIPRKQAAAKSSANGYTVNMAIDFLERSDWSASRAKSPSALKSLQSDIRQLRREFGDELVKDITTERLQRYVEKCRSRKPKPLGFGTIDKHFGRMSRILTACATEITDPATGRFVIPFVPKMPKLETVKRRDIVVTCEQEQALLEACAEVGRRKKRAADYKAVADFIVWQIESGMRVGETFAMTADWIDGDAVNIPDDVTKTGIGRVVIVSEKAQEIAKRLIEVDRAMFSAVLTRGRLTSYWMEVRAEAGLEEVHIHDLRHTAITRWRDAGIPLDTCARLAGHTDVRMTYQVYDTPSAERLRNEMRGEIIQFPERKRA